VLSVAFDDVMVVIFTCLLTWLALRYLWRKEAEGPMEPPWVNTEGWPRSRATIPLERGNTIPPDRGNTIPLPRDT
jgi:hypothetical protein